MRSSCSSTSPELCGRASVLGSHAGSTQGSLWAVGAMPQREGWDIPSVCCSTGLCSLSPWSPMCHLCTGITISVITLLQGCFLPCLSSVLYRAPCSTSPLPFSIAFNGFYWTFKSFIPIPIPVGNQTCNRSLALHTGKKSDLCLLPLYCQYLYIGNIL